MTTEGLCILSATICAIPFVFIAIIGYLCAHSVEGYEDEYGFHYGKDPRNTYHDN